MSGNFAFVALYNFVALENDALFLGFRYMFYKNVSSFIIDKQERNEFQYSKHVQFIDMCSYLQISINLLQHEYKM